MFENIKKVLGESNFVVTADKEDCIMFDNCKISEFYGNKYWFSGRDIAMVFDDISPINEGYLNGKGFVLYNDGKATGFVLNSVR